ncbi:sensor histidine kinase [Methylobacterium nodulans]|uniref:histidine kinase n=1 Tax=Methylobacterium nodulans (strain LMG 21967 / CNCM I-2342 / ORS 2060) TaxID=460265 RepID=B8IVF1_METNO|nr:HAMP domain-containing sensor histidine kinase [Methylobacterium nodulans]ACL61002.1 histidine kinase [Methylobacterium nodulans ORS 2060]
MRQGSLRLRLLAAGVASIVLALAMAGFGLLLLFEWHVERRMAAELGSQLTQLVSSLARAGDGTLQVRPPPAEPRFLQPLSGLYWQIAEEGTSTVLRSRSLWDATLTLPPDVPAAAVVHQHTIPGPGGASLLAVERRIALPASLGGGTIRAVVALDRGEVQAAGLAFASDLVPSLALLAAVLIAAAWIQVGVGLRPLDAVRRRLAQVRSGEAARLGAAFPDEVRPLAAEVDHLLDAQEQTIARARARAADLAHGLKTPLTVLSADAEELRARGDTRLADEIETLAVGMRRHVERELVRARAGLRARSGPVQPVRLVVEQVIGVLRRTPQGQKLLWEIDAADDLGVRMDAQDLTEILGNLAENAATWAAGAVRIEGRREDTAVALRVEDDGPGVPDEQVGTVLARGGRLDETRPGTGLGLAIVGDLVEANGGSLALGRSPLGGLLAEVRLPSPA